MFHTAAGIQLDISILPPAQLRSHIAYDVDGIPDDMHEAKDGMQNPMPCMDW
jgi:hypothetical protein